MQWDELPAEWQTAFRDWLEYPPDEATPPESIRGFWRVGEQPQS
jgi:hypothetical protein